MQIEQILYDKCGNKTQNIANNLKEKAQFVLVFGSKHLLLNHKIYDELKASYPNAYLIGGTTAGEIYNTIATENTVSATAIYMEKTEVKFSSVTICEENYSEAAATLVAKFPTEGLRHVFILSEGININGSKLVEGLINSLPENVTLSGGLAGDGILYKETFIIANNYPQKNCLVAIGFYGSQVNFGYASIGGWAPFGIERIITRSKNNILYELDDKPALALYKEYLGEYAEGLPAVGLYFPLMVRSADSQRMFIRTIQRVDEAKNALVFSGDVPEGYYSKLMRSNLDKLIEGARQAAKKSITTLARNHAELAILVSCVGRKLVLDQLTSEEIEAARSVLKEDTVFTGFYSYGEISSPDKNAICELHNQTMTITLITED
jgi:hypothetical protein